MKKNFLWIILLIMVSLLSSEVIEKVYYLDDPQINNLGEYQVIEYLNMKQAAEIGAPSLPYKAVSLLLPQGEISDYYEIELKAPVEINAEINLFPMQKIKPLSENKQSVFAKNDEIYNSKNIYPTNAKGKVRTEFMNGYSIFMTSFTPIEYLPSQKKVRYFKEISLKIHTKRNPNAFQIAKNLSNKKSVIDRVISLIDNEEMIDQYSYNLVREGEYSNLIISAEEFIPQLFAIKDIHENSGLKTNIVSTEEIYANYSGQDNPEKIRNFIINEYQNYGIEFVLLAGDVEIVPYRGFYCEVQSSSVYEDENIPADLYFSALDGNWNDNGNNLWGEIGEDDLLPEISVGRTPFSTTVELATIIHKISSYIESPVENELQNSLMLGEHLWNDPLTWGGDYLDLLIGYHEDNGYTTDGIPEAYNYEKFYDRDYGTWSATELLDKINEGKSFIHHSGHSNATYNMRLQDSMITNENFYSIDGLEHNYSLVYSHGCICASFDNSDCIAEKMLHIDNFAVAFVGNSRYGWFNEGQTEGPSEHLHREFVNALYTDRKNRIGETHLISKIQTVPWVTAPGQHEEGALRWCFYDCNVLGDPAMSIWTDEPSSLTADFNSEVLVLGTSFNVAVSNQNGDVTGADCSISQNGEIIGYSQTDENGNAEILFDIAPEVGDAELHILAYNTYVQVYPLTFYSGSGNFASIESFLNHSTDDEYIETGENVGVDVEVTYQTQSSIEISLTLSSEDEYVTINTDFASVIGNSSGTSVTLENIFNFDVSSSIPDEHEVVFFIEISFDDYTYFQQKSLFAKAPHLEIGEFVFTDQSGDGVISPGESATLNIDNINSGSSEAEAISCSLSVDNNDVTISNPLIDIDLLESGESEEVLFNIDFDNDLALGEIVNFEYTIVTGEYSTTTSIPLQIGIEKEDFQSGAFFQYSWNFPDSVWSIILNEEFGYLFARTAEIENNQSTEMSLEINVLTDSQITFDKKISSEENYDYLRFYIDSVLQDQWSGESNWSEESFNISAGNHTISWSYEKDSMVAVGEDCGWIDNIVFPPSEYLHNPLPVPQNFSLVLSYVCPQNYVDLYWEEPNQYPAASISEYRIYRNFEYLATVSANELTYFDDSPMTSGNNAEVYYFVTAFYEEEGESNTSGVLSTAMAIENENVTYELETSLIGNYPNPFNPETNISYQLGADSDVELIIYNLKGQEVRTLVNKKEKRGNYSVKWNGKDDYGNNTGSGVFFYKIRTSDYTSVKKMILLK